MRAPRSYANTIGKSQPCGDANQLAEDQSRGCHPNLTNHPPLKICKKEVQFVDSYTYLRSMITNNGSSSRDITSLIAKAASATCRLSNSLFHKYRSSTITKINMYRAPLSPFCFMALNHPRRSPHLRCVRHALSKAPPACVLSAAH